MAVELTTLVQHANAVGANQDAGKHIYINQQGDISGKSGLGFFKRLFSSSAKTQENRATLEAFKESIYAHPKYRKHLETHEPLERFFRTKQQQGTPLTSRDVREVKSMLDTARSQELRDQKVLPGRHDQLFVPYCAKRDLNLGSSEEIKDALKSYYTDNNFFIKKMQGDLKAAGLTGLRDCSLALNVLKAGAAWISALEGAFAGKVSELSHDSILEKFSADLRVGIDLLASMKGNSGLDKNLMRQMASADGSQGISLFNGTLAAIKSGAVEKQEALSFMDFCRKENTDLSDPALLGAAIGKHALRAQVETIFIECGKQAGLPESVAKSLARTPEFASQFDRARQEAFPPPSIPDQGIYGLMRKTATAFLNGKNEAIGAEVTLARGKIYGQPSSKWTDRERSQLEGLVSVGRKVVDVVGKSGLESGDNRKNAVKILETIPARTPVVEASFMGLDLKGLDRDAIQNNFGAALEKAAGLLFAIQGEKGLGGNFIADMASTKGHQGIPLFHATLAAIDSGALKKEEGVLFLKACQNEKLDLSTPALLDAAINKFRLGVGK